MGTKPISGSGDTPGSGAAVLPVLGNSTEADAATPALTTESFTALTTVGLKEESPSVRLGGLNMRGEQAYAATENAFQGRADYIAVA